MVTIADVAAYAGVGAGTVSRVLNDSPRVSDETRARVLEAIDALHYHPSAVARALSRGRGQTVGVVVPFFTHASAVERLRGVAAEIQHSAYDLVLFDVESPVQRDEHFSSLARRGRADGVLVLSLPPPERALARLRAADIPVVLVDVAAEGVASIVTDDVEGGRIAARHLVELGHSRIGFVGEDPRNDFGFTASAKREAGYREVLACAGLKAPRTLARYGVHDRAVARRLARRLLAVQPPPTAVFASSDVQALGVLEAARDAGMRVPDDISVIGFDDIEISAYAALTTVRQPLFESGRLGARVLLDALEGQSFPVATVHELPLELVVRGTTTRSGGHG